MSTYFQTLSKDVQNRYIEKIALINHYDPYTLLECNLTMTINDLPNVQLIDIIDYFILTHNFYNGKQFKAYKSLEAFKFYEAGFVLKIKCPKISNNFVVVAEVKHSQRMNDKALNPWLIILHDGTISSAHCTCMAGLGEVCSHTAAVAFDILYDKSNNLSCTDQLSTWNVPRQLKAVIPKRINKINWGANLKSYDKIPTLQVPNLKDETLQSFLINLEKACPSAVILSVVQPFAENRKAEVIKNLPKPLTTLYNTQYEYSPLEELRNLQINFNVSRDEQIAVQKVTSKQSRSIAWYKYRAGRITASNFKSACSTWIDLPALSTIKHICYLLKVSFKNKAMSYGFNNEHIAREEYKKHIMTKHQNVSVTTIGLIISIEDSRFGASIDGFITCDCCGLECIEIKCPFRMLDPTVDLEQFSQMKNSFLERSGNNVYTLKKNHAYYYQVQLQMYSTCTLFCDFITWSKQEMSIERVPYNKQFLKEKLLKASLFHKNVIVPELAIKWYTKSKDSVQLELWCICNGPDDGREMIRCANPQCTTKWFHLQCMNFPELPGDSFWYCKECRKRILDVASKNINITKMTID